MKKDKTEKFIENWSRKRNQGKNKYIFIHSVRYTVGALIGVIAISLYTGNDLNFMIFIALSIGGIIGNILNWHENEKKYNAIMQE